MWAGVGSEDPGMPSAQQAAFTAEMQAAGVDWRLVVYGGALHAFHHPPAGHAAVPGVGHPRCTHGGPGATSSACSPSACP